jgi:hypothetical protein
MKENDAPISAEAGGSVTLGSATRVNKVSEHGKFLRKKQGTITCNFTEADVEREEREHEEWLKRHGLTDEVRLVAGIPDTVEEESVTAAGDDKAAHAARAELTELLLKGLIPQLMRLALEGDKRSANNWAGMMLASIGESIRKYDKKLCKINAGYREERKKIREEKQLAQIIVSPKPIMETVRRELKEAEDHRRTLRRLKQVCDETWRGSADGMGISDYLPFVDLPEFSLGAEALWWKPLWQLIMKKNRDLLTALQEGKILTRGIRRHAGWWETYRDEFDNALHTLARLRSGGVL